MVSWKAKGAYKKFLKRHDHTSENPDYAVWVTVAPEVQRFCSDYLKSHPEAGVDELNLHLKQYLGLNAEWNYDLFIEMRVSLESLFRPWVDPPDRRQPSRPPRRKDHAAGVEHRRLPREFYTNLYYKSFRAGGVEPWTGIGYTYDWGNPESKRSASELILTPNAPYEIDLASKN